MRSSRFLALVAALLFLAVCAYIFCGLYDAVGDRIETSAVRRVTVSESAELSGIAVRSEQLLSSAQYISILCQDGKRVSAGALLAQNGASQLFAPCSSIYYSDVDGLEYLSPEQFSQPTVSSLRRLMASRPQPAGSSFGRLVTDYVWYFAALTDSGAPLRQGESCTVLFDGFESPAAARILWVSEAEDGERAVLLRLTCGGDCLKLRLTGAEIVYASHSGLAVPASAVRSDAGGDYVYVLSSGAAARRDIAVAYSSDGLCIAAQGASAPALAEGDVVISGENIYEGRVIG